ncbi:hypothetical protein A1351_06750 [Methylosinus sp. R-45379]|uniref:hypothetical protein n=1 Tax=unclassified Methylosinus TaxID=2624500 RepID=UPI000466B458|nr:MULTISPECIES: hypothetical protein [unclassified Methylosinus]OAI30983.1 hypothetical protein A1351_06750 [Methylosinus sp. R-45379]
MSGARDRAAAAKALALETIERANATLAEPRPCDGAADHYQALVREATSTPWPSPARAAAKAPAPAPTPPPISRAEVDRRENDLIEAMGRALRRHDEAWRARFDRLAMRVALIEKGTGNDES